jgi:hypothetical protein
MIPADGLTHFALSVRDPDRAAAFYKEAVLYRDGGFVQLQPPGSRDVLVLEKPPLIPAGSATGGWLGRAS